MAQRDLAEMNGRRFAKPTLETAGLRVPKGIGAGARGVSDLELAEGEKAAAGISALIEGGRASMEMPPDDDAPLELDVPGDRDTSPADRRAAPGVHPARADDLAAPAI